jgi:Icc-related predicted phosphoesterase
MLIRPVSDLHLEFSHGNMRLNELPTDKDTVLILAGDIGLANKPHTYVDFFRDKADRFRDVIYIMGNHEHYNGKFTRSLVYLKEALAEFVNVSIIEKETIVIDDVAFIGATLWTDMNNHDTLCMYNSELMMNDYKSIRFGPIAEPWKHKLRSRNTIEDHLNAKHYIFKEIEKQKAAGNKAVVISHHLPSYLSLDKEFKGDTSGGSLNGAYASELFEDISDAQPLVWIHGHTHSSFDYKIGNTNVVCNPRGYFTLGGNYLNLDFNEELLINV